MAGKIKQSFGHESHCGKTLKIFLPFYNQTHPFKPVEFSFIISHATFSRSDLSGVSTLMFDTGLIGNNSHPNKVNIIVF